MAYINEVQTYPPPVAPGADLTALEDPQAIQVMSDLHLEFMFRVKGGTAEDRKPGYEIFDFPVAAPNLALLGDIGLAKHDGLYDFFEKQLRRFQRVFFVPGNHEYYGSSPSSAMSRLQSFADKMSSKQCKTFGEFVLMHRKRYDLSPNVTILGCTLWSHIPSFAEDTVWRVLNDFRQIEHWTVGSHNASHEADRAWLSRQLAALKTSGKRVLVLTHHAPTTPGTSEPRFEHEGNLPSHGFVTSLSEQKDLWDRPVTTWAFGHTHFNCDFIRDGIRVVANQRGYEAFESHRIGFIDDKVLLV
ncbi:serine/threonine protein phosphatase [Auricularia subglabra TFB-10046 SS5]|nr:serine/threonine protein phosphatase [Auricularia subglabra TFB-10046 SS5]